MQTRACWFRVLKSALETFPEVMTELEFNIEKEKLHTSYLGTEIC